MPTLSRITPYLVAFVCFLLGLTYVATAAWDSDFLATEALYRDLFINHIPLDGWKMSPALFVFPDWPIYFSLRALLPNINLVAVAVASLFLFSIYLYFRLLKKPNPEKLFFTWLAVFLALFPSEWLSFLKLLAHGGAFFVGLFYAYYFLKFEKFQVVPFFLLAVVGALTAASDFFFGVQFLIPLGICSILDVVQKRIPLKLLLVRAALGVATVALTVVFYFQFFAFFKIKLDSVGYQPPTSMLASLQGFLSYLAHYRIKILLFVFALYLGIGKSRTNPDIHVRFFMWSGLCSLLCVFAFGLWIDPSNVRYLAPVPFIISWILADALLEYKVNHRPLRRSSVILGCLWAILVISAGQRWVHLVQISVQNPVHTPYPRHVACIDEKLNERGLHEGYSDYWLSKLTMNLATNAYIVKPLTPELEYFHWIDNTHWYDAMTNPRFVLRNSSRNIPQAAMLESRLGRPDELIECGGADIWIYKETIRPSK